MSYLPNEYKIYYLSSSKKPDEIRYVGLTKLSLERRLYFHVKNIKQGNSHKNNWIKKNIISKNEIHIQLLENNLTEKQAREKEVFYIKHYKEKGYKLVNGTFGGDGNSNISEITRKKISESCKGRTPWNKGKTLDDLYGKEKAEKIKKESSEAQIGKTLSKEHKKKIKENNSKYWLGKTKSKSHVNKCVEGFKKTAKTKEYKKRRSEISSKPIIQTDLNNAPIKEWKNIKEASESLKITRGNIGDCCNNRRKTASGYKWKFKNN